MNIQTTTKKMYQSPIAHVYQMDAEMSMAISMSILPPSPAPGMPDASGSKTLGGQLNDMVDKVAGMF